MPIALHSGSRPAVHSLAMSALTDERRSRSGLDIGLLVVPGDPATGAA